jgi:hypothetical protein
VANTPTLADAAMRFMSDHGVHLAETSSKEYQRLLDKPILPALGGLLITDVNRQDMRSGLGTTQLFS